MRADMGAQTYSRNGVNCLMPEAAGNGVIGDLYEQHHRRVYSLCLSMTGNASEAEDLTQEVFVQLIRKIGSFRGESQFTTWLYRLTINQVLMHFRSAKRRKERIPDVIDTWETLSRSFTRQERNSGRCSSNPVTNTSNWPTVIAVESGRRFRSLREDGDKNVRI
jgi:RNA polymerase sigma factor (sigma-70 family)